MVLKHCIPPTETLKHLTNSVLPKKQYINKIRHLLSLFS